MRFEGRRAALLSLGSLALTPLARCGPSAARSRMVGWDIQVRSEAMDTARSIVGGRCGLLVHVDRVRHLDAAGRLCSLGHWGALLEGMGLDPLRDVERAFVTAPRFDDTANSAIVLELAQGDAERTSAALSKLSKGTPKAGPFATDLEGTECVVTSPKPGMIASVPAKVAGGIDKLHAGSVLPGSSGDESIVAFAEAPSETLGDAFSWPSSVREMRARIGISRWGATLDVVATSSSPSQAKEDAHTLTTALDQILKLDLVLFQLDLLPRAEFVPRGDRLDLATELGRAEVEILLALGSL